MEDSFKVDMGDLQWRRLWDKMDNVGMSIGGVEGRKCISRAVVPVVNEAKRRVQKDTGALEKAIIPKVKVLGSRRRGYNFIWGGVGIESKSLFVSSGGKVRRPPHYYYIMEFGRKSDAARAANPIANSINPHRRAYKNRSDNLSKHPFLKPAIEQAAPASLRILYSEIEAAIDRSVTKEARK